jgi:CheY-like chemotaxis protein
VWNLLSNSVKFTPSGGSVCVSLQRTRSQLAVRVQDSGTGIAPAFLPHVFERFSQEETSTRRRHGGLGLGLSIVRHLVELHGGTVEAESDGEGQGSTFTVRLPIRAVVRTNSEHERAEGSEAATPVDAFASLSGLRILVVDDEADARELISTVLAEFGATVRVAASAAEGLACLLEEPVDALVTDVGMPGEDGYDFVRKLRLLPNEDLRAIPAVALTAYGGAADAARAQASGFHVHLTKPVEPEALVSAIARLVRGLEAT